MARGSRSHGGERERRLPRGDLRSGERTWRLGSSLGAAPSGGPLAMPSGSSPAGLLALRLRAERLRRGLGDLALVGVRAERLRRRLGDLAAGGGRAERLRRGLDGLALAGVSARAVLARAALAAGERERSFLVAAASCASRRRMASSWQCRGRSWSGVGLPS